MQQIFEKSSLNFTLWFEHFVNLDLSLQPYVSIIRRVAKTILKLNILLLRNPSLSLFDPQIRKLCKFGLY